MEETARHILDQVPDLISIEDLAAKYPVMYEESMNTVLVQEAMRYNKLLTTMKQTLMVCSMTFFRTFLLDFSITWAFWAWKPTS